MQISRTYEDRRLFGLIAKGDESAFRELFAYYGAYIHPYVMKIVKDEAVAKEIVQEVFLKVWVKRESLDAIEEPGAWINRVASNLSISYFRRRELDKRVLKELSNNNQGVEFPDHISAKELNGLIHEAVKALPPRRRLIYQMIREQGLSRREVAEQLHISENTVRNQLGISIQLIQDYLKKHTGYYIPAILFLGGFAEYY